MCLSDLGVPAKGVLGAMDGSFVPPVVALFFVRVNQVLVRRWTRESVFGSGFGRLRLGPGLGFTPVAGAQV